MFDSALPRLLRRLRNACGECTSHRITAVLMKNVEPYLRNHPLMQSLDWFKGKSTGKPYISW